MRAPGAQAVDTDEFRREIERNYELARAIGATGTPTWVIGDQVLQGAVGYETLKKAIAETATHQLAEPSGIEGAVGTGDIAAARADDAGEGKHAAAADAAEEGGIIHRRCPIERGRT